MTNSSNWKDQIAIDLAGFNEASDAARFLAEHCAEHGIKPTQFFDEHVYNMFVSQCRKQAHHFGLPIDAYPEYLARRLRVAGFHAN
jgi:hypothetical protein